MYPIFNRKAITIKMLKENMEEDFSDLQVGKVFFRGNKKRGPWKTKYFAL